MNMVIPVFAGVVGYLAARFLGAESSALILVGGLVGLACGLIPYFLNRSAAPSLASTSLWVCAVVGMVGGLLLALPTALVFTLVGYLRARASA